VLDGAVEYVRGMLVGRQQECQRIETLLAGARTGESGALVLRGEAGIGKTTLLLHAIGLADGMTVLRATGVESEAELEFSGLLELCRPVLDRLDALSDAQADALRGALALGPGGGRDTFTIGAATLALLAAAAEERPLLVVVDDAQWLDAASADALRFAGRRLLVDRVALLVAVREPWPNTFRAAGFEELAVVGLDREETARLLAEASGAELPDDAVERVHRETGGNPLALVALPELLDVDSLAEPAAVVEPLPVGERVEQAFAARVDELPEQARQALVTLAAATRDDLDVVATALAARGLDAAELQPAEDAGLVEVGEGRVRFGHPLVRSAVFHSAPPSERRAAHAAHANALAGRGEDERRAYHLGAAALGPDEEAASALAEAARTSAARGGLAAASAAFEQAARLSPDAADRVERLAEAAETAHGAGTTARAAELATEVLAADPDAAMHARALRLLGRVELQAGTQARAREHFLEAADLLEPIDPAAAVTTLGFAVFTSHFEGRIAGSVELSERARAIAARDGGPAALGADYVLGRSLLLAGRFDEGAPLLESVAEQLLVGDAPPRAAIARASTCLAVLERLAESRELAAQATALARADGPMALVYGLTLVAELATRAGDWQAATAAATEGLTLARDLDQANIAAQTLSTFVSIEAARGEEAACRAHAAEATARLADAGMELPLQHIACALGLLDLGLGRVEEAVAKFEPAVAWVAEAGLCDRDVAPEPDLVDALLRLDRAGEAAAVLAAWQARGAPNQPWAAAAAARCKGMLAGDDDFEATFETALALHERVEDAFAFARTRLAYGERLRRAQRRVDARQELRAALEGFERLAAEPWAERARRELRASGETLRRRQAAAGDELTPQELQIALHVAEGRTNREVGSALFLSPKTVEFHLARVFRKLDIANRAELIRRFAAGQLQAVG
jgi:DNA-binding CsgD family transcriptional regulator